MSPSSSENVTICEKTPQTNVPELTDEELALPLEPFERKNAKDKKKRRRQAIVSMMNKDSHISVEAISEKLDVHKRTILRDIEEPRRAGHL